MVEDVESLKGWFVDGEYSDVIGDISKRRSGENWRSTGEVSGETIGLRRVGISMGTEGLSREIVGVSSSRFKLWRV